MIKYRKGLTQSMAMKSAPMMAPRTTAPTEPTFSLVTSIIGTVLNLALPYISLSLANIPAISSATCLQAKVSDLVAKVLN